VERNIYMMIKPYLYLGLNILRSNFGRLSAPYKLTFSITNKCNMRCKTCNIWRKNSKDELQFEEIEKFFERSNKFCWVDITGGEQTLRREFLDIAKVIINRCKKLLLLHFPTNGFLTNNITHTVRKILHLGVPKLIVSVSLDGPKDLHDEIRGISGSWERSLETFRQLRNMKGVESYLGMTLSPYNADKYKETFSNVKKILPWVQAKDFHLNIAHTSFSYDNLDMQELDARRGSKNVIINEIEKYVKLRGVPFNPVSFLEHQYLILVKKYLQTGITPLKCQAFSSSCFISPNGSVYPCSIYNFTIGNLRDYGYNLERIWNSELGLKVQKEISKYKCPQCWTPCEAYQSILGNLLFAILSTRH